MPGVYITWLEALEIAAQARPGQFVMVRCGEDGSYVPLLRRPLSIHRRSGSNLALLFAVIGRGTEWLSQRQKGDVLDILGPLGTGFCIYQDSKNLLLVAGGMGIAPLVALADDALSQGCSATLVMGARDASYLYPESELPYGLEIAIGTEDGSKGQKGLLTEVLPPWVNKADQIFACGPIPMYQAISRDIGVLCGKSTQVCLEQVLGCGYGICYGCTIETVNGPKQVCQDGPVFELREIVWRRMTEPGVGRLVGS